MNRKEYVAQLRAELETTTDPINRERLARALTQYDPTPTRPAMEKAAR